MGSLSLLRVHVHVLRRSKGRSYSQPLVLRQSKAQNCYFRKRLTCLHAPPTLEIGMSRDSYECSGLDNRGITMPKFKFIAAVIIY